MKHTKTGTAIALLLATIITAPGIGRGATMDDASENYALTDPATGKTGAAQATATAIISQNMVIEYVTPMNLGISGKPGESQTLRLIAADRAGTKHGARPLTAAVAVQGLPNQTFAVSIDQAMRGTNDSGGPVVTTFTHNAGQTPHIGPAGDTEFMIGATIRIARNTSHRGYNRTLDLIVSHN